MSTVKNISSGQKRRVGVLISGRGSNMQALVEAARADDYPAEIAVVISNRSDAAGLDWARENGIATAAISHKSFPDRSSFDARIHAELEAAGVEFVALAGFMRILTAPFVALWQGRMINMHPSLLPLFPGLNTHDRAIAAGMKLAGCTVHFVTAEMDVGPIIAQAAVPILPSDTPDSLAARTLIAEHLIYPRSLAWVVNGSLTFETASTAAYGSRNPSGQLINPQ